MKVWILFAESSEGLLQLDLIPLVVHIGAEASPSASSTLAPQ